jgi:N-acetyl-alpha-D-glucosaminyl L-malate synthase BshA
VSSVPGQTEHVFGVANAIRVIHNFVNTSIYKPLANRSAGEKTLLHISNFRPVKRVLDCIRILAEVRKHVPAHLLMVGDGPDRGAAEHLARELNLARHVSSLGKQNHVERLIPLAHVLLMPSETESFGLVALEAMACGVAPVATRAGGVPELITDGENGFMETPGDVDAQAARTIALLSPNNRWLPALSALFRDECSRADSIGCIPAPLCRRLPQRIDNPCVRRSGGPPAVIEDWSRRPSHSPTCLSAQGSACNHSCNPIPNRPFGCGTHRVRNPSGVA